VLAWRTPYGYRRQPRDAHEPARLEVFEPEAAIVRRIFDDYVHGGHSLREIIRRLAADDVPSPTGRCGAYNAAPPDRQACRGAVRNGSVLHREVRRQGAEEG
jgi:hypothetical protein